MGLLSGIVKIGTLGAIDPDGGGWLGDITGTNQAAKGQKRASDAQLQATRESNALLKELYGQSRADQMPFQLGGYAANNALLALAGLPQVTSQQLAGVQGAVPNKALGGYQLPTFKGTALQQLAADPGYQFRLQQGQQALERSAAARGGLFSGRAAKDLVAYGQGMGSQEFTNRWNRLAGLSGAGQTATNAQQNASQAYGQAAGENILQGGNARATGYLARGNQQANTFNSLLGAVNAGAQAYSAFSDRRLKSNIRQIGQKHGFNWYAYDIFGQPSEGVMADEVQAAKPEAVSMHPSGYLMVDYAKLGA